MKATISALVLAPVVLISSAKQLTTEINAPVTITIESTMPLHPVRLTIVGSGLSQVVADSLRSVVDSVFVWTPARLTIGTGPVDVLIRVAPGEPSLFLSSSSWPSRLEVWGDGVELRRESPTTFLQVLSPAMRTRSQ